MPLQRSAATGKLLMFDSENGPGMVGTLMNECCCDVNSSSSSSTSTSSSSSTSSTSDGPDGHCWMTWEWKFEPPGIPTGAWTIVWDEVICGDISDTYNYIVWSGTGWYCFTGDDGLCHAMYRRQGPECFCPGDVDFCDSFQDLYNICYNWYYGPGGAGGGAFDELVAIVGPNSTTVPCSTTTCEEE
jgi:hypothetical protein